MGHRVEETYHYTEAEARDAQVRAVAAAVPGYSEVYGNGCFPCRVIDPSTNEERDGWVSRTETYYG